MAAPEPKFTVIGMTRIMALAADRRGKWDRVVAYVMPDGHGSSVFVPDEDFTEDTLRAAIAADMQDRVKWLGQSFPVK